MGPDKDRCRWVAMVAVLLLDLVLEHSHDTTKMHLPIVHVSLLETTCQASAKRMSNFVHVFAN